MRVDQDGKKGGFKAACAICKAANGFLVVCEHNFSKACYQMPKSGDAPSDTNYKFSFCPYAFHPFCAGVEAAKPNSRYAYYRSTQPKEFSKIEAPLLSQEDADANQGHLVTFAGFTCKEHLVDLVHY